MGYCHSKPHRVLLITILLYFNFFNFSGEDVTFQDVPIDVNLANFPITKDEIFKNLFSKIMLSKVKHCLPDEALNEILSALLEASHKSNLLFKNKLKQALLSENSKY